MVDTLLAIINLLHQRVQTLEETVQQLRDESAMLKGQAPRPKIAPRPLTQPTPQPTIPDQKRPGSDKRAKNASFLTALEVRLPFPDRPSGALSNGYEEYLVQERVLEAKVTRYGRSCSPGGTASPPGVPQIPPRCGSVRSVRPATPSSPRSCAARLRLRQLLTPGEMIADSTRGLAVRKMFSRHP